jgi:DNA-binding NarL/FixJ family response regulator
VTAADAPAGAPRVLLVDDDADVRGALRGLLEDEGIEVVGEAGDGLEAVDSVRRSQPDVVLMDLRMPRLDGIGATRRIRELAPNVQVVVSTAYEDVALQTGASRAGAFAFLVKGCGVRLLLDVLQRAWVLKRGLDERAPDGAPRA